MRHGAAVDPYLAASDGARHLTLVGRHESRTIAATLAEQALVPTHVYSSPLVRALQTAEVAVGALELDVVVVAHPPLVPGGDARALQVLENHAGDDCVLFVSHMPTVSALAAHLCGTGLRFSTSGVAAFESSGSSWRLVGRADPISAKWAREPSRPSQD